MKDKNFDDAFKSFWQEASYKKPNYSKPIQTTNVQKTRNPSVQRISQKYRPQKRIQVRTLPTQRQTSSVQDYYSAKTRSINQQADYLLAQKKLYNARIAAREAGYRSPREKALEYAKQTGTGGMRALQGIANRAKTSQKVSGVKDKVKAFFKKSIYD